MDQTEQKPQKEVTLDKNNPDSIYNWICFKISSPSFRNIIKDFIDDNCNIFIDVDENTFQQGQLFNEFNQLLENLLGDLLVEGGITQEQFLEAAQKGLEDGHYKKYFDQILNFSDYNYFKSVMTKRNYTLIKRVEEQMDKARKEIEQKKQDELERKLKMENQKKGNIKTDKEIEEEKQRILLNQFLHKEEEEELQKAIQQSLQFEDEKRKMEIIEEEELKRAIKQSLIDSVRAQPEEKGEKKERKERKEKKEKVEESEPIPQKEEPKKEDFKISKNDTFNFSEEKPSAPLIKKEEKIEEKPKPNLVFSSSKGTQFKIEGKKKEEITPIETKKKPVEFQIDSGKNDFAFSAPTSQNPYARPTQAQNPYARPSPDQQNINVKIENTHIKQQLIDDSPRNKKEKKDFSPTLIEIGNNNKKGIKDDKKEILKEAQNANKNENKKSFNLLQFEENTKEENIEVAKEIKREKASDIIKNTIGQHKQTYEKDEKNDDGLLIDDDEDIKDKNDNVPKTNTFIDKKKDINLGKIRVGKEGGNFLNNFSGMKNYEIGGLEKMENRLKESQFKSVIGNQYDEDYQNKLKEVEMEKQAKLKEYREYLLKIKKEKRENKAKEVLSPEELAKLESKKRLAEQLKAKRK